MAALSPLSADPVSEHSPGDRAHYVTSASLVQVIWIHFYWAFCLRLSEISFCNYKYQIKSILYLNMGYGYVGKVEYSLFFGISVSLPLELPILEIIQNLHLRLFVMCQRLISLRAIVIVTKNGRYRSEAWRFKVYKHNMQDIIKPKSSDFIFCKVTIRYFLLRIR